ncbi:MAG TPA: hypothetical protein VFW84_09545 [Aquabacterium sp.]|uniref:hypothetical protein n=1 Tax=Aquabacterium sp. TaxID=1872578 RepID=UPI002E37FF26|nr:hypothetical protein [Aquabacterium sp.]HEX5372963.1 hypothetical protein [Aquabacterium sp.]
MRTKVWLVTALSTSGLLLLGGCGSLLPRGSSQAPSTFTSFEAAREALERIEPYRTTTAQLKPLGFDVDASANVRLIPYPQVITRLAPNPNVTLDMLDPGIRDCIAARQACRAYEFLISQQSRRREGAFLLDFLNFRRTTEISGWRFEGLIVVRDELVLFRNYGGEPQIKSTDRQSNPLGPLQPAGESAGSLLMR